MSKLYYVGIDSGKGNTKVIAGNNKDAPKQIIFPTKMEEVNYDVPNLGIGNVIDLNGIKTLVGVEGGYSGESTKKLDLHRRSAYKALALTVPNKSDIVVAIGCTLNQFKNPEDRNEYIRFMLNLAEDDERVPNEEDIKLSFLMDGVKYTYNVKMMKALPEASGYLLLNEEQFEDEYDDIAILDFGGRNVNGAIYRRSLHDESLNIQLGQCFTIDEGANSYKEALVQVLNSQYQLNLQLDAMETALLRGYVRSNTNPNLKEESKDIISKKKAELINAVVQKMLHLKWSVDSTRFIFIGGGSLLFREEIMKTPAFGSDIIISDQNDKRALWYNVMGFAKATGLEIPSEFYADKEMVTVQE